ncbi:helix-turn-helix transcriptional regulator [Streptomyces sp. SR27]|uniref:helix-turn-helix transcriptional regulator n=1 Tax=unclassified Streptomyces TaxID=2593676 RepID=UPI00295AD4D6|nr:helix-turn-helix transcriptional regulator [Streptomyces sp. SR27]MDV9187371.1 helix-turn-helix transcriptional regulator [Streptomyces sp. SR27]
MAVLGLTAAEEEIYRHLLRNPGVELDDVHVLVRQDRLVSEAAVRRLRELQVIREGDGKAWPHKPELVVNRLAQQRLDEFYSTIRTLSDLNPLVDALRREAHDRGSNSEQAPMERLMGLSAIRERLDELAFFARTEVLSSEPYTALTPENIERSRELDLRCLRRGVVLRTLVRASAVADAATRAYLQELTDAGARIRVIEDLSELMIVYDRHTALVPVDPKVTSKGALCSSEEGIVTAVVNNFERLWAGAVEFADLVGPGESPSGEPELTDLQVQVLRAMCTVAKDETGARQVGAALRTYRRHISELMRILGAENRAHAALLARERGWV